MVRRLARFSRPEGYRSLGPLCGLILVLLLSGCPRGAQAQGRSASGRYVRTQWTAEDGLPVNSVNDMVQTEEGYLWLATYDGLVRFDGLEFKVYRSAQYDGLPSNRILTLLVRSDGIWMRTESRTLVRFHDGTFTTVTDGVRSVYDGPNGRLWIGSSGGLSVYREGAVHPVAPETIRGAVSRVMVTEGDVVWAGTRKHGVFRLRPDGRVHHLPGGGDHGEARIGALLTATDGDVWIGTWGRGIRRWDAGTVDGVPTSGIPNRSLDVFSLATTGEDTCWAATNVGILQYRDGRLVPALQAHQTYTAVSYPDEFVKTGPGGEEWLGMGRTLYRDDVPVFRAERPITSFLFDREGALWIGTSTQGLFRLRPSHFTVYGEREGLASGNIYPIEQRRDGSVWVGTLGGGLAEIDAYEVSTYHPRKRDSLQSVWALHEDRSGQLWVGSSRLCQFVDGHCKRPESGGPISGTRIQAVYEDRQRRLWVGTVHDGVFRCDSACGSATATWIQYTPGNSGLPHSYVRSIHESPNGTLWFGTNGGGVARYKEGSFSALTAEDGLSSNLVRDVYQDTTQAGTPMVLWVVTEDKGLNRVELSRAGPARAASITVYQKRDGLYDNATHQVLKDDQGRFWISSNRGIFWVQKAELEAFARGETHHIHSVSYTTGEGLRSREANGGVQPAGLKAQDGRLWFPTQKGAAVVDPATIETSVPPPPVAVETVTSKDSVLARQPEQTLRLAPEQRNFKVEYTGMHLSDPHGVRFRYRLRGLHADWRDAGTRRQAYFTNVPPGRYTFEVAARVRGGGWSEEPAQVTLTVAPFMYETWWFFGLCALGLSLLGVGTVRYWLYRQRRREARLRRNVDERTQELAAAKARTEEALETVAEQAEQLRELDEMKSRFFANISHELRTPLSVMVGPVRQLLDRHDVPDDESEMLQIVHRNAKRLQRLVEHLLELARYDAGRLDLELREREWAAFVERVTQRFLPMAEAQGIHLAVETEEANRSVVLDPDQMETVVATLVRNALTHTPRAGEVTIRASATSEETSLVVQDTGPGLSEVEQEILFDRFSRGSGRDRHPGTGIGLALARALVTLHEGAIDVDSEPGKGRTFSVRWPTTLEIADERSAPSSRGRSRLVSLSDVGGDGDALDEEATEPPSQEPNDGLSRSADRTTVLVVEDNAGVRRYVRRLLEPRYRVIEADDGRKGMKRARSALPDLVVADVMMPEVDGFEMLRGLRTSRRTDCIPVVMLTARAEPADRVEGLEEGADAYVTKPFSADALTAQIDGLITTRRQLRKRYQDASSSQPAASPVTPSSPGTVSFEERVRTTVRARLSDPNFSVQELANEVGLARRTVTRKAKEAFGRTPSDLIRAIRVERGAELLAEDSGSVSEVAYAVGFNSLSYFSRSFKEHFGVSPSAYKEQEA